ncbi:MAG: 50S ribosomal protein L20 [Elusimicrobia bacterium]|nr:50S ribosomal protein L20 [Elusimicrobiota bacterium]
MRIKSGVYTRQRKKKYFRLAKGSYSNKGNRWRMVHQHVEKSLEKSYIDRKKKKRNYKKLWISRINAIAREFNLPYNKFMNGLVKSGVTINRKMLADMAVNDRASFTNLMDLAKKALAK